MAIPKLDRQMSSYKRHGGKRWRHEQVGKIKSVLDFAGVKDLEQLGSKQIIAFYKSMRENGKSVKTQQAYFYALAAAYREIGRLKEPPRPHSP
jgi:hypothetical protein